MILHFFGKKENLRTIYYINNKNRVVVFIVRVFCKYACACASAARRRPCEPFPRASWEPFPLALCARVAPHEPYTLHRTATSHLRANTIRLRHFSVRSSSLHFACVPPDSCMQFLYTLSYFFTMDYTAHPWNSLRNRWQN